MGTVGTRSHPRPVPAPPWVECLCPWCGDVMDAYSARYAADPHRVCERRACQSAYQAWSNRDTERDGVFVHEWLGSADGMSFTLLVAADAVPLAADRRAAEIVRSRDVVGRITRVPLARTTAELRAGPSRLTPVQARA